MKVANYIEVGGGLGESNKYTIDQRPVVNNGNGIQALTQSYIYSNGKVIKTLDGSVQEDIVVNVEDKEALNVNNETKKLLNEERETKREMLFRQARLLYPEKEEWCLSLAIDAFMYQEEKGIDITTYKFEVDAEKY